MQKSSLKKSSTETDTFDNRLETKNSLERYLKESYW